MARARGLPAEWTRAGLGLRPGSPGLPRCSCYGIDMRAIGNAGDECDGSVESASCRSPMGRPRERAHGRPVGAGAQGNLAPGGAFGDGLEQARWNRRLAADRLEIGYKALLHKVRLLGLWSSVLGAFQQACGASPPGDPTRRRLPTLVFQNLSMGRPSSPGPKFALFQSPSAQICFRTDHCFPWSGNGTSLAGQFLRAMQRSHFPP